MHSWYAFYCVFHFIIILFIQFTNYAPLGGQQILNSAAQNQQKGEREEAGMESVFFYWPMVGKINEFDRA